jgi:hypothetical protein
MTYTQVEFADHKTLRSAAQAELWVDALRVADNSVFLPPNGGQPTSLNHPMAKLRLLQHVIVELDRAAMVFESACDLLTELDMGSRENLAASKPYRMFYDELAANIANAVTVLRAYELELCKIEQDSEGVVTKYNAYYADYPVPGDRIQRRIQRTANAGRLTESERAEYRVLS